MQIDLDKISFPREGGFRERGFNIRVVIMHYRHWTTFVDPKDLLICAQDSRVLDSQAGKMAKR